MDYCSCIDTQSINTMSAITVSLETGLFSSFYLIFYKLGDIVELLIPQS